MKPWIEGTVSILQCAGHHHLTPHLTFSGDSDMVTLGLASLSSIVANEIVVAEMIGGELADGESDALQNRINRLLVRDDLRSLRLRRVEAAPASAGTSFQQFRQAYSPPRLVFQCPRCASDAIASRSHTPTGYTRSGGVLTVLPELDVRD
jgi:hypothetical protein